MFMAAFVLFFAEAIWNRQALEEKTLRLHVVANSDSPEDQAQKLRVREHILRMVSDLTDRCNTREETENVLRSRLMSLEASVRAFLQEEGSSYDVTVTLCREDFDTRDYDTFSLPAGTYHSLRVVIGEGEGQNWWCVVFPSLCTASSVEEFKDTARKGGYEEGEIALIRKEESRFIVQFKMVEIIKDLFR